ncbi:MAG: carboxymuconolactone decarboxylase family protein [Proteobacteria bacterium]|nr:carboxymuconolactone decarboxylase family protein [Pseudomonadota bacterium]
MRRAERTVVHMADEAKLIEDATRLGIENFTATRGSVPESFQLLLKHAPGAFAGYSVMRASIMKESALDLKTKELIFALLDTALGITEGAKVHAANAVRLGLPIEALSEGLVQCIICAGITCWNTSGKPTLEHAIKTAEEMKAGR